MKAISKFASSLSFKQNAKPAYTPPDKKGEINELKQALSDPMLDKDQMKKREVLQKVIQYSTMGLDTSKLFDKMILCVNTKDIVQKKMVYQYVTHHSSKNPELALMTINTLARDCKDENPIIRALALRSLASLRVPKIAEHLLPLIKGGLGDSSPYVRKTAALSVVKLNKINPQIVKQHNLVDKLYEMLRDNDVQVLTNCIDALDEILEEEGGMKVTKRMIYYLLNRVGQYNEWQLTRVLELLLRYQPEKNEVFDIMNLLDDRLMLGNAGTVMAIAGVFLEFTNNMPKVHLKVYGRLKDPLLLLLATASHELAYTILQHIKLMITRASPVFANHFKDFFIKHNDPTYLKVLKLEVLTLIANEQNVSEIMEELGFYVTIGDNDTETSKSAIRAIGEIAVKISNATETSLTYLLDFLEMDVPHILTETFVVLKDILRKYNNEDFCSTYLPQVVKHWKTLEDAKSQVSFVWILGEFGEIIDSAPYILEIFIENFKTYHHTVRLQILTAAMKLFFKRAPEMQAMLGTLFTTAIEDTSHADVHDRALLYYRLLKQDVILARKIVMGSKCLVQSFAEEESSEIRDRLFSEFNSLSVVYGKPQERFIIDGTGVLGTNEEEQEDEEEEEEDEDEEEEDEDQQKPGDIHLKQRLIDSNEEFSFSNGDTMPTIPMKVPLSPSPKVLLPNMYQEKWQTSAVGVQQMYHLKMRPSANEIEKLTKANRISCIAVNVNMEPNKYYFYAQKDGKDAYFLIECNIFSDGRLVFAVKSDEPQSQDVSLFAEHFTNAFASYMS